MGDRKMVLALPARWCTNKCDINDCPGGHRLTEIGKVMLSGICTGKTLRVWQDDISKIIFWGETGRDHERYLLSEKEAIYEDLYPIPPEHLEQMCHYIMGWDPSWWGYDDEEREILCNRLRDVMPTSPTYDQIFDYIRYVQDTGPKPLKFAGQWWANKDN